MSVSLDIVGRKRLLTRVEHHVCDWNGRTLHASVINHWPEAAHEVETLWFSVPTWVRRIPMAASRVVVRDDRQRLLCQHVAALPHPRRERHDGEGRRHENGVHHTG